MTSSRLPGKVMLEVGGRSLLEIHLHRLARSGFPVVIATTENTTDDPIIALANSLGIPFVRGSEADVLSRFWLAAETFKAEHIVRVTSDCPLIDGELIGSAALEYLNLAESPCYLSNCEHRTFPRGLDFEIFPTSALMTAQKNAVDASDREQVTPYIKAQIPGLVHRHFQDSENFSQWRLTVDQHEDFKLLKILIEDFHADQLSYPALKALLKSQPNLAQLNAHIEQKKV